MKLYEFFLKKHKRLTLATVLYTAVAIILLARFTSFLYAERQEAISQRAINQNPAPDILEYMEKESANATPVKTGVYIETIRAVDMKNANYRLEGVIWFAWEGKPDLDMANHFAIYQGQVSKRALQTDYHEGNQNYQMVYFEATIFKSYDTKRFPLESHTLTMLIESEYPVRDVMLIADENSTVNENLEVSGFTIFDGFSKEYAMRYESAHSNPVEMQYADEQGRMYSSMIMNTIEINRESFGLYIKCFIALVGTTTWALMVLYVCANHHVDPLGMIPAALFGSVTNIMVGANLLPDALTYGLLEFVNIWGMCTILAVAIAIVNINRIRSKYQDKKAAKFFGRVMFYLITGFTILGHIIMPLTAYIRR